MKRFVILFFFVFSTNGCFDILTAAADCNAVPMVEWAGEPSHRTAALAGPVNLVIIQHTATAEPVTDTECVEELKDIRKMHMELRLFDDVGQSFLVCGNGKVYEGAGWSLVGAHTRHYNNKSIGISFIGNFEEKLPSSEAIASVHKLISCGVENRHLASDYKLIGHRQLSATISPGDALQKELTNWSHWTDNVAN